MLAQPLAQSFSWMFSVTVLFMYPPNKNGVFDADGNSQNVDKEQLMNPNEKSVK